MQEMDDDEIFYSTQNPEAPNPRRSPSAGTPGMRIFQQPPSFRPDIFQRNTSPDSSGPLVMSNDSTVCSDDLMMSRFSSRGKSNISSDINSGDLLPQSFRKSPGARGRSPKKVTSIEEVIYASPRKSPARDKSKTSPAAVPDNRIELVEPRNRSRTSSPHRSREATSNISRYFEDSGYAPSMVKKYNIQVPFMTAQSTPVSFTEVPSHHDTFGSQIDYNQSWMPKEFDMGDLRDPYARRKTKAKGLPAHYLRKHSLEKSSVEADQSSDVDSADVGMIGERNTWHESSVGEDSRFLLSQEKEPEVDISAIASPKKESLLQWFDRTVEEELQKRRNDSMSMGENLVKIEPGPSSPSRSPLNLSKTKGTSHPLVVEAGASGIDLSTRLLSQQETDLTEAVDKLAKAEAMCHFAGAIQAAEEAAAAAPPEYAEEAAAAGARGYQAEIHSVIHQTVPGLKPVEVVGYVGITGPRKAKKTNNCSR